MEDLLNKKSTRIIIGLFIATPFTVAAIIFGLYGIILGIAGVAENNPILFLLSLISISGLVGVLGAWRRLVKTTTELSDKEQNKIRTMLFFGLASTVALCIWSVYLEFPKAIATFILILTLKAFFIYGTPKNSNKQVKNSRYHSLGLNLPRNVLGLTQTLWPGSRRNVWNIM